MKTMSVPHTLSALSAGMPQDLRGKTEERGDARTSFADVLASRHAVAALDYLFANPVFSNSRFIRNAGIPGQTAARFSRVLLQQGLLETVREPAGQLPAIYRFEPLMRKVRV